MIPSSERPPAPEIDSAALATTIAAYQRSRRLLDGLPAERSAGPAATDRHDIDEQLAVDLELIHETRIARARLRQMIGNVVADGVRAGIPKTTLVRRINDQVNSLVRRRLIEPEGPILAEIIEWIVEGYPSDLLFESVVHGARPTPPHSRDVIPLHLLKQDRAG
jgi:hypothetical protein